MSSNEWPIQNFLLRPMLSDIFQSFIIFERNEKYPVRVHLVIRSDTALIAQV